MSDAKLEKVVKDFNRQSIVQRCENWTLTEAIKPTEVPVVVTDLCELKGAISRAECERKSWVDPLNKQVKRINNSLNPPIKKAKEYETHLKSLLTGVEESMRKQNLAKVEKEALKHEEEGALQLANEIRREAATETAIDPGRGVEYRDHWVPVVKDPTEFYQWIAETEGTQFAPPNLTALRGMLKTGMEPPPGVVWVNKKIVAVKG